VANFRANAFAESTRRTYKQYLSTYFQFCGVLTIPVVPISPKNLGRYIAYLAGRLAFRSIRNYLSVVRILHLEAGHPNPIHSYYASSIIKGAKRVLGDRSSPKLPITPPILLAILANLDIHSPRDITFWAACLVAFFSFFRKSNLFVPSLTSFTPGLHLARDSVSFTPQGVTLRVTWTKTIQFRQRVLDIPIPRIASSALCPAQALLLSFKISPSPPHPAPLFSYTSTSGLVPLTYPAFLARLNQLLLRGGIDPARYSGHSFRRGGVHVCASVWVTIRVDPVPGGLA
jgi:hypothetical protein